MTTTPEFVSDAELLNWARKGLYDRTRLCAPDATQNALQDLKQWIGQEVAFEEGASASFGRVLSELWHAEYLDQLPALLNRFERLVSAYYVRRGSVTAFHGFCNAWRDGVLRRILQFAEEGPDLNDLDHPPAPYALLASGMLGRREQTLEEAERYVLVWKDAEAAGYHEPLAYRVLAILDQFGLIKKEGTLLGNALWHGSLEDWRGYLDGEPQVPERLGRLETMADLRLVCGDEAIGREALRLARSGLVQRHGRGELLKLARSVVDAPVALGILGGIRVAKTGEYAGCCNPEQAGLAPLIGAVRLLSVHYDLDPASTSERLAALGALRVLGDAQVERLAASYHVLAGLKVRREIALRSPYLDPKTLTEKQRAKLRASLEAVRQLQRVVRRTFLGKDRRAWVKFGDKKTV